MNSKSLGGSLRSLQEGSAIKVSGAISRNRVISGVGIVLETFWASDAVCRTRTTSVIDLANERSQSATTLVLGCPACPTSFGDPQEGRAIMDELTVAAYDAKSRAFADTWHTQPDPSELHELVRRFFHPDELTADIGCGAGRDTAWLNENGYPAIGYDPSAGLLAEARRRHPGVVFVHDGLPELRSPGEGSFANVLCETVIMHLPVADLASSVCRLLKVLRPGGILYLSWRVAERWRRDDHGRLYSAVDAARVLDALDGAVIKFLTQYTSRSSGASIQTVVAESAT